MLRLVKSGTLFQDAHGGLWVTCAPDAPRAVACGPTGSAHEADLGEFICALATSMAAEDPAEYAGFIDGATETLRLVGVQTLTDLINLVTRETFLAYVARFCWAEAPDESRVLAAVSLPLTALPDGEESDLLGGCIAVQSPHGTVVLTDFVGEDDEGAAIYARAVVVGRRTPAWPPWDGSSRGLLGQHEPVVRRDPAAYDLYTARGLTPPKWIALGQATGTASSVSLAEADRRNCC